MNAVLAGLMTVDPRWAVVSAWRCGWSAEQLAQCYDDMPVEVAEQLLACQTLEEAAEILGCDV